MKNKLFWLITIVLFATLSGCLGGGGSGGGSDSSTSTGTTSGTSAGESNVSLNLNFTSLFSGHEALVTSNLNVLDASVSDINPGFEASDFPVSFAAETFSGTLTLFDNGTTAYTFPITASLDASWDAALQQTFAVKAKQYNFVLQFQENSYQYQGSTTATIVEGDTSVDINVSPVIGNTMVSATVADQTPTFRFNYDAADFDGLSTPELDVIVDSTTDTLSLAQFTANNRIFINLEGDHNVSLLLRDGTTDVARYTGTNITFEAGTDLEMDLTAIFGRFFVNLTESGGDAFFELTIPEEVVAEVNNIPGNLRVTFSLDGDNNEATSDILILGTQDASNDYPATTTISGIQYDDLAINIEFADTLYDPAEIIGLCNFTVSLDASPDTGSSCGISLVRRADITGDFLQAVAFNVVDATGDATSDALIYYNDGTGELVSTSATGSGGFGTVGYLEMLLKPGSYNFRAEKGGLSSIDVSADIDAAGPGYLLLWLSN